MSCTNVKHSKVVLALMKHHKINIMGVEQSTSSEMDNYLGELSAICLRGNSQVTKNW